MKICKGCGENLPLNKFYYDKKRDFYWGKCRICAASYERKLEKKCVFCGNIFKGR